MLIDEEEIRSHVMGFADKYELVPKNRNSDGALTAIIAFLPGNTSVEHVLTKSALLNSLYSTQIYDIYRMAEHIVTQDLDGALTSGSIEAVSRVREGHGITTKMGKERDLYSFATKYCHWHKPKTYPMYDVNVARAIRMLNTRLRFAISLSDAVLSDYQQFKGLIDICKERLRLDWPGYKRLDQALWMIGRDPDVRLGT